MRRFLPGMAIAAFLTVPAMAADMPVKAPAYNAPAAVPIFNWTGFYVGGTIGGMFGSDQYANPFFTSTRYDVSGVIGGLTAGYNLQTGNFVFGIEGDFSWSNAKGNDSSGCNPVPCTEKWPWLGTIRGRIGYAFDRFLPYLTGGAAFSRIEQSRGAVVNGTKDVSGWTIGGGFEAALTNNWSIKAEYLHVDVGNPNVVIITRFSPHEHVARVGVNYRFGGPLVARY
jgi:outer membrane immunogenic protein